MNKVGDVLRILGKLDKRLIELLILVAAREWNCDYQWVVHEAAAVKAGLSPKWWRRSAKERRRSLRARRTGGL